MIHIGLPRIESQATTSRLCCDITTPRKNFLFWYEVEKKYEKFLCTERVDAFLLAVLPVAFTTGLNISCAGEISARLHYQLTHYYIPAVSGNCEKKQNFSISGPVNGTALPCAGKVVTGFSGGVDSMYTVMSHTKDPTPGYALTHLATFNNGAYSEGGETPANFQRAWERVDVFAREQGLESLWVNSNLPDVLAHEIYLNTFLYRNVACALALQKLFSVYLHSSSVDLASFSFANDRLSRYEFFGVHCFSTENTAVYCSGAELTRIDKFRRLYDYAPSHTWLHPCVNGVLGDKNCGKCLKCLPWYAVLYLDDVMHLYEKNIDAQSFLDDFTARISEIILRQDQMLDLAYVAKMLTERGYTIDSRETYRQIARILRKANARKKKSSRCPKPASGAI